MTFMIKVFYIMLLTLIIGITVFLMYGELPAPTTQVEKILPNDYFFSKR